ncbi:MAG: hypothetical protein ACP5EP_09675 [Acidobacteriaceae bacterium]
MNSALESKKHEGWSGPIIDGTVEQQSVCVPILLYPRRREETPGKVHRRRRNRKSIAIEPHKPFDNPIPQISAAYLKAGRIENGGTSARIFAGAIVRRKSTPPDSSETKALDNHPFKAPEFCSC